MKVVNIKHRQVVVCNFLLSRRSVHSRLWCNLVSLAFFSAWQATAIRMRLPTPLSRLWAGRLMERHGRFLLFSHSDLPTQLWGTARESAIHSRPSLDLAALPPGEPEAWGPAVHCVTCPNCLHFGCPGTVAPMCDSPWALQGYGADPPYRCPCKCASTSVGQSQCPLGLRPKQHGISICTNEYVACFSLGLRSSLNMRTWQNQLAAAPADLAMFSSSRHGCSLSRNRFRT